MYPTHTRWNFQRDQQKSRKAQTRSDDDRYNGLIFAQWNAKATLFHRKLTRFHRGYSKFTREILAIEVAWSFKTQQVIEVLRYLFAVRGTPEHIRSDNGPKFVATAVTRWLDRAGVKTLFIAKGGPWKNGTVKSFNSRFRDEFLNRELFVGLEDARWVVGRWRVGGSITTTKAPTVR
jgi:transposase InsO family protein